MPAPDAAPCEALAWDSEFWGFPIARIRAATLDDTTAEEVREWCTRNAVRCAYLLAAADDPQTPLVARRAGLRLVDVRMVLSTRVDEGPRPSGIRPAEPADAPALASIARRSHHDSRFYFDPGFPDERCDDFYETWIRNSLDGFADAVLVWDTGGRAEGYVTCSVREGAGSIGLIAVGEDARGRGAGASLVQAAGSWLAGCGAESAHVVTQLRNVDAQRLYQNAGYRTSEVGLWYHWWLS